MSNKFSQEMREAYHLRMAVNAMGSLRTHLSRCVGLEPLIESLGLVGDQLLIMSFAAAAEVPSSERAELEEAYGMRYLSYETPFGVK